MLRKGTVLFLLAFSLLGCDGDYEQGICDEGFFEQTDGNGSSFCVPITDTSAQENYNSDVSEKKD